MPISRAISASKWGIGNSNALTLARRKRRVGSKAAERREADPLLAPGRVCDRAAGVHGVRFRPRARARCAHIACSVTQRLNGAKLTRFSHRAVSAIGLQAFTACDSGLALGLGGALGHVARTSRAASPRLHASRCTPRGGCPRGPPPLRRRTRAPPRPPCCAGAAADPAPGARASSRSPHAPGSPR